MKHSSSFLRRTLAALAMLIALTSVEAATEQTTGVLPVRAASSQALSCTPTGGTGGLDVGTHETTIAGRPAVVIVGQGYTPSTPTKLSFYLHGDEGGYQRHESSSSSINQLVNTRGWIYVAPHSAQVIDGNGSVRYPFYADFIKAVLDEMFQKYNVCRDIVFGSGASQGSFSFDYYFYPVYGDQYPIFMNLNCGAAGHKPEFAGYDALVGLVNKPTSASSFMRSELHYTIGTMDFLYPLALDSVQTYRSLGVPVSTDYLPNVGHCLYDTDEKTRAYWIAKASAVEAPLIPSSTSLSSSESQETYVGQPFPQLFGVTVLDASGLPVPGVTVYFNAPASGPSASFLAPSATTNSAGVATIQGSANAIPGSYTVSARVDGVATSVSFSLTNKAILPTNIALAGGDQQQTVSGHYFAHLLVVTVRDADGHLLPGVNVDFTSPNSTISARPRECKNGNCSFCSRLGNASFNCIQCENGVCVRGIPSPTAVAINVSQGTFTTMTGVDGKAYVAAFALSGTGSYVVTAAVSGIADTIRFNLINSDSSTPQPQCYLPLALH